MYLSVAPMRPTGRPGAVAGLSGVRTIPLPIVLPRRARRRGVGATADSIIAQQQAEETSSFVTPAMLANQAAALQNECAVDPYSGACAVAQQTGDIYTGQNLSADTTVALTDYCRNTQDPASCNGSNVKPSYLAQAAALTGAPQLQQTKSAATVAVIPVVTIANQSRPGQPFIVGDSWVITISGAPNQPVAGSATYNGAVYANNTPFGTTDASGKYSTSGTFSAGQVGTWSEVFSVGGTPAASITFTVAANNQANTTPPGAGSPSGILTPGLVTAAPPLQGASSSSSLSNLLSGTVNLFGYDIPVLGLGAGALVLFFLMQGGSRR